MSFSDLSPKNEQVIVGPSGDKLTITPDNGATISDVSNIEAKQAIINPTPSAGVTAFANINNTVGGNLTNRKTLRIYNQGKRIRWRINGELTGNNGEHLGNKDVIEFEYDHNIVVQLVEANGDNEIDVIITETR